MAKFKLTFFVIFLWMCCAHAKKLKLCVVKCKATHSIINEICPKYEKSELKVGCVVANDRSACINLVVNGVADFTVSEPEDLVIAVENLEYHIVVTHELRMWKNETFRKQMITLMHNDLNDVSNVQKSKLCYPGLDASNFYHKDYTSYFEKKLIPRECDPRKTLLENRISSLSNYFEAACIAGAWSFDSTFDNHLKTKYKNLCALCANPVGCYADDKYYGNEGALICLTENVGDVAWTRFDSANKHFKVENVQAQDFNYLCSDGTVRSVTSQKCSWIGEPWPVVTARTDVAEQVSQLISRMVIKNDRFLRLLQSTSTNGFISQLKEIVTPDIYLGNFSAYTDAVSPSTCYPPREVRWCVTSNLEYRKCETMKAAAYAYNIYPQLFCVQEPNRRSCMIAIKNKRADIFVIQPNEEFNARKYKLMPILHMLSNNRDDLNTIGVLVKRDSKFNSFKDLKNSKACFTGYKSVGWNAVVAQIINSTDEQPKCSDVNIISNYFGESCVYGLSSKNITMPNKLYNLCNDFKENRSFENYSNDPDIMALKCLSNSGDVAFVNISRVKEVFQQHGKNFAQTYKTLCTDKSSSENCFMTWTTLGSIMIRENTTSVVEDDTREMILALDRYFGVTYYGQTPLFSLYGPYDNTSNAIFPDKTKHLHREINHVKNGKTYSDILQLLLKYEIQCIGNTANYIQAISINLIACVLILYLPQYLYF